MPPGTGSDRLSGTSLTKLASCISGPQMEPLALGYLGFNQETVNTLKEQNFHNPQAFNREVLRTWTRSHQEGNQVKTLATLLYRASNERGLLSQDKVEAILGVPSQNQIQQIDPVSEEEFLSLAKKFRQHTLRTMRITPAPWTESYTTDMDQLYCKLTLQKIDHNHNGLQGTRFQGYRDVFSDGLPEIRESVEFDCCDSWSLWAVTFTRLKSLCCPSAMAQQKYKSQISDAAGRPKKVLALGDQGMGKTTMAKKIAYDWAKGAFTTFIAIFFISLNGAIPSDTIESVIIKQNPWIEGLHISEEKLKQILTTWGPKCLLILDGLDEHKLGSNQDIVNVVERRTLVDCNIFVTSRPHDIGCNIEKYFDTLVKIDGFSWEEATKYACAFNSDKQKVLTVLDKNGFGQEASLYKCPILLSFMCVLVKEEGSVDPPNDQLVLGEMYTKMVRCLYKKHTLRKGLEYNSEGFTSMMTRLGRVAWRTLSTGKNLVNKNNFLNEVGKDVFDLGFLFTAENFHSGSSLTSDVMITWPHRTIEEFFGAFFCIWTLSQGQGLELLLAGTRAYNVFLTNPMFAHFCLWLMTSNQSYFQFDKKTVYRTLLDCSTQFV